MRVNLLSYYLLNGERPQEPAPRTGRGCGRAAADTAMHAGVTRRHADATGGQARTPAGRGAFAADHVRVDGGVCRTGRPALPVDEAAGTGPQSGANRRHAGAGAGPGVAAHAHRPELALCGRCGASLAHPFTFSLRVNSSTASDPNPCGYLAASIDSLPGCW
jgi:hypothetical protein